MPLAAGSLRARRSPWRVISLVPLVALRPQVSAGTLARRTGASFQRGCRLGADGMRLAGGRSRSCDSVRIAILDASWISRLLVFRMAPRLWLLARNHHRGSRIG